MKISLFAPEIQRVHLKLVKLVRTLSLIGRNKVNRYSAWKSPALYTRGLEPVPNSDIGGVVRFARTIPDGNGSEDFRIYLTHENATFPAQVWPTILLLEVTILFNLEEGALAGSTDPTDIPYMISGEHIPPSEQFYI